ncbi:hypothetical protein [Streptomyces sp. NPDC049881]
MNEIDRVGRPVVGWASIVCADLNTFRMAVVPQGESSGEWQIVA